MKNKVILGISFFYRKSSACLLVNGEIIAAAENERFSRTRNDKNFPIQAINFCLDYGKIDEDEVDYVFFYEFPSKGVSKIFKSSLTSKILNKLKPALKSQKFSFESLLKYHFPYFKGKILFSDHYHAHVASAFYPSPYKNAAIITIDGLGKSSTTNISVGNGNKIQKLKQIYSYYSIGFFYSVFAKFLGLNVSSDVNNIMSLAQYGKPRYLKLFEDEIITISEDGSIQLNTEYFNFFSENKIYTKKLEFLLNISQKENLRKMSKFKIDTACSVQLLTEKVVLNTARFAKKVTKLENLCISGSFVQNCVENAKIVTSKIFKNIWVQQVAGDSEVSIGAAYYGWYNFLKKRRKVSKNDSMKSGFLGPSYSTQEIKDFLELYNFPYEELSEHEIPNKIVKLLTNYKIIGVLQGRMGFGSSALCARSIIGDPRNPKVVNKLDLNIGFNKLFEPIKSIILGKELKKLFQFSKKSECLLFVNSIKIDKRIEITKQVCGIQKILKLKKIPSFITAYSNFLSRIQSVDKLSVPRIRNILAAFYSKTQVPLLINKPFNLNGDPVVCSLIDAYRCMMTSDIDYILLENILVSKNKQPKWFKKID